MPPSRKRKRTSTVTSGDEDRGTARRRSMPLRVEARNREKINHVKGVGMPTEREFNAMEEIDECAYETSVPMRGHSVSADSTCESSDSDSESDASVDAATELQRHVFRPGDTAVFASEYDDTPNIWVGIITELRKQPQLKDTEGDQNTSGRYKVWLKVKWAWSGKDLDTLIKSFHVDDFAPFERALSEYTTFEDAQTLVAMDYLHEWDEGSLDPPELQPTTLFTRSLLSHSRKFLDPRPGHAMCIAGRCIRNGYLPFPDGPQASSAHKVMHFCPRTTCRMWYHRDCLIRWGALDDPAGEYMADRGVRLLTTNPDEEHDFVLLAFHAKQPNTASDDEDDEESTEGHRDCAATTAMDGMPAAPLTLAGVLSEMSRDPAADLAHLPPALVRIAQCPIVRQPGPARDGWYPAGNVKEVVLARRLVYAAIERDFMDDGWPAMGPQELTDRVGAKMWYATPYAPFWERRERELEGETWMDAPPVLCPRCKGAI